ncbi:MAG: hypothetical protein HFH64_11895 [Lachnospiraceae bacterium]|nr:hypothetical protein [Lachnospiraceae bacterium]
MSFEIIPKKDTIPEFDHQEIKLKHILYYPNGEEYEEDEITEEVISRILKEIPEGIEIYLSLDSYGEDDWLEVVCDGEWLSLAYMSEDEYCSYNADFPDTYNADFSDTEKWTPLTSGGQSPIEKCFAIQDIELGIKAVEYFIRTGELYPGIDWAVYQ